MAKPSKAQLKEQGVALKSMVKIARKRPLNFALLIGKEGLVLETHIKKGPMVLRKLAKANGGGAKGATGQLRVEGKSLIMSVETEPPGNLAKLMKMHLTTRGLPMKVTFELPGGVIMDDGESSEEADAAAAAPKADGTSNAPEPKPDGAAQPELDKIRQALEAAYNTLKPKLEEKLAEAEVGFKDKADKLRAAYDQSMASENMKTAKKVLEGLKKLYDSIPEPKSVFESLGDALGDIAEDVGDAIEDAAEVLEDVAEVVEDKIEEVVEDVSDFVDQVKEDIKNKERVEALHVPKNQQDELVKLAHDNPKSFAQTVAVLKKMQEDFGELDTSSEGAANAISAVFAAETKVTDLVKSINAIRAAIKAERAALKAQKAETKKAVKAQEAAQAALDSFKAGLPDLASMPDAEKLKSAKQANALINALEASKQKAIAEKQKLLESSNKVKALQAKDAEAFAEYEKAVIAKNDLGKDQENLELKKTLLDSLDSGVLAADATPALSDKDRAAFVDAFRTDPKMAALALDLAGKTDDPGVIARNIGMICDKLAGGFADKKGNKLAMSDDDMREMAENALKMGARQGEDYFKGFEKYLESGAQLKADPCGGADDNADPAAVGKKRSAMLGGAMLDSKGKLDPGADKAKAAIDHMLFHPGSLMTPAPAMVEQMQGTIKDFSDPVKGPQMKGIIDGIDKTPTNATAKDLIAQTNGIDVGDVDANSTKQAVLSAMFTPLAQGPVGSCFSTAPARKMRYDNPVKTMEKFTEIATTGLYSPAPGKGLPIKAVKTNNLPDGENPLMRSFEYSAATAGARLSNSRERDTLNGGLFGNNVAGADLGAIKGIVGDAWDPKPGTPPDPPDPGLGAKLQKAIAQKLQFKYNAKGSMIGGGGDGSSREGGFELVAMPDETPILTKAAFIETIEKIALETCGETKTSEKGLKIIALVNDAKFIKAVEKSYGKKPKDDPTDPDEFYSPWEMSSGGFEDAATEALVGGSPSYDVFLPKQDKSETPSERNADMLSHMIDAFSGATTDMVSMGTTGKNANHAFNALPKDPSWDMIRPPDTDKKIQSVLVEPGKKIADTPLEVDKTAHLYEARIKALIGSWGSGQKSELIAALKKPPTKAMKPAELSAYLLEQTKAFRDAYSKAMADNTKAKALATSKPFTQDDWDKDEAKWQKNSTRWISEELMGELVNEVKMPEIKIADTNWGDNESHTFFVMSPDPLTGELILWKKDEIKGTMVPAGDNWSDAKWDTLK